MSFRSTLRRTPKPHAIRPFRAASPTLPILSHPPVSLPPIFRRLFQVPYPVSPLFATLTKTAGVYTKQFPFWNSFPVHLYFLSPSCSRTYGSPFCNPFPFIFIQEWGVGGGVFRRSRRSDVRDVQTFRRSFRPIAAQTLWCNNSQRRQISLPSGETTPLSPVSKTTRADNGTALSPLYPDRVGVASRAWVQRSKAVGLDRTAGWLEHASN